MDPGRAGHIAGLVVSASERTSTSSSSAHGAEWEEKGPTTIATARPGGRWRALAGHQRWSHAVVGLGHWLRGFEAPASGLASAANGAKTASTGPPSRPRHNPPPEWPHAMAPEAVGARKTQQRAAASWNGPWPSTNGVYSRSWAWPGWRPAPSGADVAWRSWSYCPASDGLQAWRRAVMRARTRTRAWKSRPASDGAWSSPLHRKSAGWHQVSLLLHRRVFQVRLGTTFDQQGRHWDGRRHAGHSGRHAGHTATGCAEWQGHRNECSALPTTWLASLMPAHGTTCQT